MGTQIPQVLPKPQRTWRWQWPSSPPSSARIKANCRGWSHPEHTEMLGNRSASRAGPFGVPHPTDPPLMVGWSREGEGQGQGLQFWHTGNFRAFPKPSKPKAKLWRCQHIEWHSKKTTTKLSSWFNSQMPSLQFQPTFSDRNLCFSQF